MTRTNIAMWRVSGIHMTGFPFWHTCTLFSVSPPPQPPYATPIHFHRSYKSLVQRPAIDTSQLLITPAATYCLQRQHTLHRVPTKSYTMLCFRSGGYEHLYPLGCHVIRCKGTDVSEEHVAPIFRSTAMRVISLHALFLLRWRR